jgi:hypothetical protein
LRKESKAPSAEPVSGDRGKRRARGLVHRRLAGDDSVLQMSSASLRESDASFALDDDLAQRRPCFVRLKASQLWLFERSSDSEAICCAALTRNLPIHETADGGITIAFVRGEDRMVPMLAASSFSPKTITLYFVSGGAEWLNALRQLTTSAPNEQPQQHQEQQQQQQPDFTAVMQSPTESPASPFEFETENFTTHRANVPFEKMATIPNSTAEFFNRILWRMFQEMATISVFEEKVGERIVIQLKKKVAKAREMGKWPSVLEEIKYGGMIKVEMGLRFFFFFFFFFFCCA